MTIRNHQDPAAAYRTLDDIQERKEALLEAIRNDGEKMQQQWQNLFRKPDALNKSAAPAKRITSFLSLGTGMFDAAIMGWKLYRKFKK